MSNPDRPDNIISSRYAFSVRKDKYIFAPLDLLRNVSTYYLKMSLLTKLSAFEIFIQVLSSDILNQFTKVV